MLLNDPVTLRVSMIRLEGIGPKLLVSDLSTADVALLRWRIEIRGNNAVEFGTIPASLQVIDAQVIEGLQLQTRQPLLITFSSLSALPLSAHMKFKSLQHYILLVLFNDAYLSIYVPDSRTSLSPFICS
jgi:hypothetical protein